MTTPSGRDAGEISTRLGIPIHWTRQFLAGLIGLAALIVGTLAVFETNLEAGPVALLAVGAIFLYVGLAGLMPTRVKIGSNELDWSKAIERIEQTTPEVSKELRAAGVAEDEILPGNIKLNASEQVALAAKITSLSRDVKEVSDAVGPRHVPPAALLQLARGCAAQRMWIEAARYYDLYIEQVPADWEAQFARGVAHANSRMGDSSDRAALDAYDAAIAHKPDDVSARITSRLFTYRGAMKKRLKMLRQAEADAVLGKSLASDPRGYERIDATYNLAAIKAMKGDRDGAMAEIRDLVDLGQSHLVKAHLNDYFGGLRDDPELQSVLA